MPTMTSALDRVERLFGGQQAVIDQERVYTWSEHMERVRKVGGMLIKLGIGPGDRFGIICENSFRYTELLHAGYWMGAIPVPINHRLAPPEIKFILEDASCSLLALGDAFLPLLDSDDLAPWRDRGLYIGPDIGPEKSEIDPPQYELVMAEADPANAIDPGEDDLALLLYTGGTTGRSKGVKLSHKNIVSNGMQVVGPMSVGPDDVYLHVAPMFHAADLLYTAFVLTGAAHSICRSFQATRFCRRSRITALPRPCWRRP